MGKNRLEAFSDGVLAIIITIMVLELKVPHGVDWSVLQSVIPVFASYVLSFVYVGIYWNNHHHLLHSVQRVSGSILWANLHLLFWLSLFPFSTAWIGENMIATLPVVMYGFILLMAALAYFILQYTIIKHEGENSPLAEAIGRDGKGKLSVVLYMSAIPTAFINPWISIGFYVAVALLWLVPDKRIESMFSGN
ncbi:MAG TPA: TMEM175 family protein [Pseudomonadales bacterium]|nr:TMEM175 family protein [Pseudomonadales bacterium]